MTAAILTAAWLGLLTAISPCPLATNIAAVSYLGRHAARPARALRSGVAYVAGRTLCYTLVAAALAAGLLAAATVSDTVSRVIGLLVGPVLIVAGAMLLGILPMPKLRGRAQGKLADRLASRGDALGAFLLGIVFALSFCPVSAAIFFGSLIPLAARSQSVVLVPATFGVMTGVPVLAFACIIAAGGHGLGKAFDRVKAVERWLRAITGVVLMAVGLYLSLRTNLGL
jgi:cytochrome c biogenesis protein CcdA